MFSVSLQEEEQMKNLQLFGQRIILYIMYDGCVLRSIAGGTQVFGRWTDPVLRSACSRRV